MAKGTVNVGSLCREIVSAVKSGQFAPVYLLMGDEPYYTDMVCDADGAGSVYASALSQL